MLSYFAVIPFNNRFKDAISNDLNTSMALTILYDVLKADINNATKLELIKNFDEVLSLDLLKGESLNITKEEKEKIESLIEQRNQAKQNKEYEKADQIREELLNMGIIIKDTREGTTYEKK